VTSEALAVMSLVAGFASPGALDALPPAPPVPRVQPRRVSPLSLGPRTAGPAVGTVFPDQVLRVRARRDGWIEAERVDGTSGWLPASATKAAPACRPRSLGTWSNGRLRCGRALAGATDTWTTWDWSLKRRPNRRWRRFGNDRTIQAIERVAGDVAAAHPGRRLLVADVSRTHGGSFDRRFGSVGHATHQNGLDVDVVYPRHDGREKPAARPSQVDLRLSREIVRRFAEEGAALELVGCARNYASGSRRARRFCNGEHEDHVHVRFPRR
jgi:hypothetical protein